MSRNSTCELRQDAIDRPKIYNPCHWTTVTTTTAEAGTDTSNHLKNLAGGSNNMVEPVYLEPLVMD
jgi:hypothetical protein